MKNDRLNKVFMINSRSKKTCLGTQFVKDVPRVPRKQADFGANENIVFPPR